MGTPSILQQRLILAVFATAIGVAIGLQNVSGSSHSKVQKISLTSVSNMDVLDFTKAEAAWSGIEIDSQGNLKINALTETALLDAMTLLHEQPSELRTTRMALLLEKQFGATASRQIMELLPVLQTYKETEQQWWQENGSKNPPPHEDLFKLQDELLGRTLAEQMFSEQRRLVNMMRASQQIRNDSNLTQAEKEQALNRVQAGFNDEGARDE